jgi:hypothetical protein
MRNSDSSIKKSSRIEPMILSSSTSTD